MTEKLSIDKQAPARVLLDNHWPFFLACLHSQPPPPPRPPARPSPNLCKKVLLQRPIGMMAQVNIQTIFGFNKP